jgi:hypothetical protein
MTTKNEFSASLCVLRLLSLKMLSSDAKVPLFAFPLRSSFHCVEKRPVNFALKNAQFES